MPDTTAGCDPAADYAEFEPLYEMDSGEPCGPLWGYYAKGHLSDAEIAGFAEEDGYNPVAFTSCAVRTYAHRGPTGEVFYHATPGRGRFACTVVDIWEYRRAAKALGENEPDI